MTLSETLKHFDVRSHELADMLGVTPGAVSQWRDGIPIGRQWQIELITNGELKAKRPERSAAAA